MNHPNLSTRSKLLLAAATACLVAAGPVTSEAGQIKVTSNADAGPGSLRAAVAQASADPSIDRIRINKGLGPIIVESEVEYTGAQSLTIAGSGATIQADDLFLGLGILTSSGGASLSISDLTIDGDFGEGEFLANGIYVPLGAGVSGELSVSLKDVTLLNCGLFGLHVADQLADSDATIVLDLNGCLVENCGIGALDFDGVRVDKGGLGDIVARLVNTSIDANGGDGLELDERGPGDVFMEVVGCTFDDNGFFNEEDLDDGLDIDEAGEGGIVASVVNTSLSGNLDEGLDLDEEDGGGIEMSVVNVTADGNLDEGIKASEEDEGGLEADLRNVSSSGSADNDGIQLEEADAGSVVVTVANLVAVMNDGNGLKVEQDTVGSDTGTLKLRNAELEPNGDDGLDLDGVTLN